MSGIFLGAIVDFSGIVSRIFYNESFNRLLDLGEGEAPPSPT
jgi:hypothetical protein